MPTPISTICKTPSPPTCPSTKQGQCPCTPHRALWARGRRETCSSAGVYRRSATGLAARGQGQCPCTPHRIGRHAARPGFYRRSATGLAARNAGQRVFGNPFGLLPCKIGHAFPLQFNPQGLRSISTHAAAKQSGDRQRREKGSPILTAEKGEHERAPNVSDSYPTPLRATLRAPPSKWAIKGFFP